LAWEDLAVNLSWCKGWPTWPPHQNNDAVMAALATQTADSYWNNIMSDAGLEIAITSINGTASISARNKFDGTKKVDNVLYRL